MNRFISTTGVPGHIFWQTHAVCGLWQAANHRRYEEPGGHAVQDCSPGAVGWLVGFALHALHLGPHLRENQRRNPNFREILLQGKPSTLRHHKRLSQGFRFNTLCNESQAKVAQKALLSCNRFTVMVAKEEADTCSWQTSLQTHSQTSEAHQQQISEAYKRRVVLSCPIDFTRQPVL